MEAKYTLHELFNVKFLLLMRGILGLQSSGQAVLRIITYFVLITENNES